MSKLFHEIFQSLVQGNELVLATVIEASGSTPRIPGADMIVYSDGKISGTIGGGIVEGEVIRSALDLFKTRKAVISSYNLNQTGKTDDMDLVCGGQMRILVEHVAANKENKEMFGLMCEEINMARPFLWIGKVTENGRLWQVERAVQTADNRWLGPLQKEPALHEELNGFNIRSAKTAVVEIDKERFVVASIQPPETVYIIGGGHVSKEIALLAKQVGFRTLVFDDRQEFANSKRFPEVDGVFVCADFTGVFDGFRVTPQSFIIIVTRAHRFDREVLAQALRTEAGYIGMIGSRKKRKNVYQALINEGFEPGALDQVHCPIGLAIEAETPAEIAVSIMGELIQHRAKRKSSG